MRISERPHERKENRATERQPCVLALADDLTGALETGARFAAAGVPTVVSVELSMASDQPLLVIDTETRHLAPADAAARVYELASEARACGVRFIYKKTDSTLRGNIGAELGALRRADPDSALVYAPAYPAMGRTVRRGRLYVDGVPVSETAFARDPLNPVCESDVASVLAAQTEEAVHIHDGETEADITAAAQLAVRSRLAAGPAALAGALAHALDLPRGAPPSWPPLRNALFVNGSLHPASLAQQAHAAACGWPVIQIPEQPGEPPRQHAHRTAREVRRILDEATPDTLVVFGGDTAFAILTALGRPPLYPVCELVPGVPLSRLTVAGRTLWLITKAGGFGLHDVLDAVRAKMEKGS